MRGLGSSIVLLGVVVGLVAATTATSSSSSGGISVRALPVQYTLERMDHASGTAIYSLVAPVTWSPEAPATEGGITYQNLDDGGTGGNPIGRTAEPRTSDKGLGALAAYQGQRYVLKAHWRVYVVGAFDPPDGTADSAPTVLRVPKTEPAPRLSERRKQALRQGADAALLGCAVAVSAGLVLSATVVGSPLALAFAAVGGLDCGIALTALYLSRDPIDPNFRSIAKPRIPAAPKVSADEGLSSDAARAANELLAMQAREIGLGRAILTAFNRSQGAHVKHDTGWEKKQVRAAGRYAAQLAAALLAEVGLRGKLELELDDPELSDLVVSEEDARGFEDSLIRNGLPAQLKATLSKIGLTKADQAEVNARLLIADPLRYTGDPVARIADPKLLASIREMAAGLTAFSKKAARDPLHTGQ